MNRIWRHYRSLTDAAVNLSSFKRIYTNTFFDLMLACRQPLPDLRHKEHKLEATYNKADGDTKKHARILDSLALFFVWAKNNPTSLPSTLFPYLGFRPRLILTHLQQLLIIQINS